MPPQLPPLPPQPSLTTPSNWKLHYPPEDINLPPSSWSAPIPTQPLRRSKSTNTSLPRRLPEPSDQVAGDSATRAGPSALPFFSGSKPRSHSRSRSNSRVPLPVVPSASSPELMIISPPMRTHSRSVSIGTAKPPTSRPSSADKDKERDPSRAFAKVPRQLPPPPLPLLERVPIRDQSLPASCPGVLKPSKSSPSPALPTPATPPVILSAPPRPAITRQHSSPHVKALAEAPVPMPSPSASPASIHTPRSAPVRRPDQEKERERERERLRERAKSRERRKDSDQRPVLVANNPDEPFLNMHIESAPVRAPIRAPTPPRPRTASTTARPPFPIQSIRNNTMPSSWKHQESRTGGAVVSPTPRPAPIRGRGIEVAVTLHTSPGVAMTVTSSTVTETPPPAPPKEKVSEPPRQKASEPPTRKWVLERKGKRLTQDTMVVAQQLRMLR
ncbi:hypothetical protein L226DRAFT_568101 [Lentinus tigrinus ALCF2SS1-7]|uniref:uncharacterized protein n=1 Tax=Lentinus tigrinus ALCF2SS1-7 TaxID=1328758 RepID=UPI00116614CD|nr:hypothetical protein L226DRAFT_568101 [Lentinus tigrinus ALCF2SS1-7]